MAEPMIMDAIASNAIGATNQAVNNLISLVISRGVDYFMGESKEERKKRLNEYYDRVKVIVDEHQRVTPLFSNGTPETDAFHTPQQRAMNELDEVDGNLMSAVRLMETARDKSRCGVCKSKIDETLKIVKETTDTIGDATDKIRAMQQLKSEGKLDPNALWEMLTPDQKRIVEQLAKNISKMREERSAQESAAAMLLTPIALGAEEEEGFDNPKPRQRKPRASKPRKPKATKRATPKRATPKRATPKRKKSHPV